MGQPGSVSAERLEDRTLLAAQLIRSDAPALTVSEGETFEFPVVYQTRGDDGGAAALPADQISFNLHFDADALTFVEARNIFDEGLQVSPATSRSESDSLVIGDDNDNATETVLLASYQDSDSAQNPGWPNTVTAAGQTLYIARFTVKAGFTGTTINFSANATGTIVGQAGDFTFQSDELILLPPSRPTLSILNAATVVEGQNALFTVRLSSAADNTVTVNYSTQDGDGPAGALSGEDYTAKTNQTLTFNPGETQKTISIATTDDSIIEATEEFSVTISNAVGAAVGATVASGMITDNDASAPTLSIANAPVVTEGSSAQFIVSLSAAAQTTVTVDYATADGDGPTAALDGIDIVAQSGQTLTFTPGQTQKTITVNTIDDTVVEPAEPFRVILSNSSGAAIAKAEATGTINDNETVLPELSIANAPAVTEGGESVFTVTMSAASASDVTVSYSTSSGSGPTGATNGVDFLGATDLTLTFLPGQTQKTITITTNDDTISESTETFVMTLSNAAGATLTTSQATGTINDNESGSQTSGNVDGDSDFDANDSFLIQLVKLSGTDAQINQTKGGSPLSAAQIRANINALGLGANVDGDQDFDANDAFLIHLVKLSGTDAQIDQSKGSSPLSAAQIRANINALGSSSASSSAGRRVQSSFAVPNGSADAEPGTSPLVSASAEASVRNVFGSGDEQAEQVTVLQGVDSGPDAGITSVWEGFREWIDVL